MHSQLAKADIQTKAANSETSAQRIWSVVLIALVTVVFYSFWWNRFLGGSGVDGVFFFSGKQILAGRVPYRDFSLSVPPWDALQNAFLIRVFGEYVIIPRLFGFVTRIVLASVMFIWLRRFFQPTNAFLATLLGIVVFSASGADPVAGYNHDATFWAVLAGFCASRVLGRDADLHRLGLPWLSLIFAGIFAALSFLTKQTTGLGATAAIGTVLVLTAARTDWRIALRRAVLYVAGWMIPFGAVSMWLVSTGSWSAFVDQVFVSGPSSKGSLVQVFTRPISVALSDSWLRQELVVAIAGMAVLAFIARRNHAGGTGSFRGLTLTAVTGVVVIFVARALATTGLSAYPRLTSPHRILLFIALFGSIAAVSYYFGQWALRPMPPIQQQMFLLAGVSAAVAYMHSLSFVVTESMCVPGLPFLTALALNRLGRAPVQQLARTGIVAAAFGATLTAATYKMSAPFSWYGFNEEPVQFSTETSSIKQLAGLRMSARSRDFIDRLHRAIRENLDGRSSEYAFFYLPLAYIVSDAYPPTTAFNHFIDVAPDQICRLDAGTLEAARPSVIVYTPLRPGEILDWEKDFRAGHPSGQRDLIATLEKLIAADYRAVDTLQMPGSERAVIVYARK